MPRSAARHALRTTLVLTVAAVATPGEAADWRLFANPRFGFSVEVPAAYRAEAPSENGDGRGFASPDGAVAIAAYGHYLSTPGDLRDDAQAVAAAERQNGLAITYRDIRPGRYAFSGTVAGRIVYVATVPTCGGQAAATVRIAYPATLKARLDPVVTHVAASLRGSARCA